MRPEFYEPLCERLAKLRKKKNGPIDLNRSIFIYYKILTLTDHNQKTGFAGQSGSGVRSAAAMDFE